MLVSRKNLALIHFVSGEATAGVDVTKAAHDGVHFFTVARLRGKLHQPFPEHGIERLALRARQETRLLNQVFVGAEGNILHTILVYTISVLRFFPISSKRAGQGPAGLHRSRTPRRAPN